MKKYTRFGKSKQQKFKQELSALLERYDITIEAIDARDYGIESIDFCDRCGVGLTTELAELCANDILKLEAIR